MGSSARRGAITFYTSNPGKVQEVRHRLAPLGVAVRWGRRTLTEPQSDSLEEVARFKLQQVPPARDGALVEDAGLFVRGLAGFPGVYSAYVLRTLGPAGLARLTPSADRSAVFRAVLGFRRGHGRPRFFVGEAVGTIAQHPRGTGGFGFDPVFIPRGEQRTFAEMTLMEKERLSHRGKALTAFEQFLKGA
ncbi:MAG: RdgB/HAM1 family non-canonical purine NTP pyrophosphatase [Euryarchaeota archaeon]|nr:RdgB/HAM1 family non-canonical purine NTP pyrophosphatase [Euryarchaeota archaeon]MDE2046636.1 RdgB/HAM1 family non-canonical purine NTP pyrophosphatase [Thermoplasmata archaeon]